MEGQRWTAKRLYGRPVLLHFWATWCAPCIGELPVLDATDARYPDLVVLGASVDEDDRRSLVAWLHRRGPKHPVIHLPGGLGTGITRELGVPRIPWAVLFDVRGRRLTQGSPMSLVDEEGRLRLVAERPSPDER
jgi:thiol-disulfide isomerase/thioredoxin